ncbi:MAG: cation:proton antiporter [Acidobacteria bacterium]|nr:cation:proton antiporter [Acidobacteriota bacterium]
MHTPPLFGDLLIILLVSVPVAFLCLRLKLPLLVGLILSGIAIGPYGLGWIHELEAIEVLAEIGVMLLLFTIGLEFSLRRLREMKTLVLVGGGLQVLLTVGATAVIAVLFGRAIGQAVFFGFLVALSSTAIVLKSYVERSEVDAPHGRAAVGILLFQDISVVLMLLLVPILGGGADVSPARVAVSLGGSILALILLVLGAWFLLPPFLRQIAQLRSTEAFLLTVVLLCLGMSWVTSHFGLSLALGAFIAGMVLADSDYSHQVTAEILPFRDVFNSLFFVSIGMLLSLGALFANLGFVAAIVLGLVLIKALIIWGVIRVLGLPLRIATMTALGLAQIGEFSFVLARAGKGTALLPDSDYQTFLAASIISMLATPFLIAAAPRAGYALQGLFKGSADADLEEAEQNIHMTSSGGLQQHVIIVGYGLNGRNLARVLRTVGIPYVILELNAESVRKAKEKGEKINFGDATRREVLLHAGIDNAWALVLAMSDAAAARRTVDQARRLSKTLQIIVRTRYVAEITELYELGANEVIPEEFETSIEIFSRVLHRYGSSRRVIENQIERIRRQGYEMLRSPALPEPVVEKLDLGLALDSSATETVTVENGSPVAGKTLAELDIRGKSGATVIAVVRDGDTKVSPGAKYTLMTGDLVILFGTPEKVERAMQIFFPPDEIPDASIGGFNA